MIVMRRNREVNDMRKPMVLFLYVGGRHIKNWRRIRRRNDVNSKWLNYSVTWPPMQPIDNTCCYSFFYLSHGSDKGKTRFFLHTRPGFPWTRLGLGNVVLNGGCKMTLVHDVSMTILTFWCHFWRSDVIFDVLTSFSRQFPPNVSTSTYKRGAVLSLIENIVILA